ncbi:penicillin-binding protein 2 [Nonomuraea sediminis]|uniref:penicillin-binding protein 2 n=1 Tax=Nonomuraea sediminis TaxID=2835864 RepID=UPI001BDCA82B|nr:penicillin-binding protein 2 [Nonomuraea sediminis]
MRPRLLVLHILFASLMLIVLGRLWDVQIRSGDRYAKAATESHIRHVVVPPVRGEIVDSRGRPLVRNRTAMVVSVDYVALTHQRDGGRAVLERLAGALGLPYQELASRVRLCEAGVRRPCWPGSPYQSIPVAEQVSRRSALQIAERPELFPGVSAELLPVRQYPYDSLGAHLLGYIAPGGELDPATGVGLEGRDGLEAVYDADLRGSAGSRQVVVDTTGQVVRTVSEVGPVAGNTLVTSIDAGIQQIVERSLRTAVTKARGDSGAAVVMDVRTGRIVAMAGYPTYSPSVWTGGISTAEYRKLRGRLAFRAIQGQWPPGSTWKITSTAAAVRAGYDLNGTYSCPGSYMVGDRSFRNFDGIALGTMNLHRALSASCDTIFYRFAYELWLKGRRDLMPSNAKAFGFGRTTGVDLPGEAAGRVPDRRWKRATWLATKAINCKKDKRRSAYVAAIAKEQCLEGYRWRAGDAANFAIGQGDVLVTPLQLVRAYAALANGGKLFSPRVAKAVVAPDGRTVRTITPPVVGRLPVSGKVLAYIRRALSDVPRDGTAAGAFHGFDLDKHPIAGKTGTAESYGKRDTSWFASFAPAAKPRLAVVVMISQGGTGASAAAPAVRRIWEGIYR